VEDHEAALTQAKADREAAIKKECVEWVFRLTGGELDDKPWEPFVSREDATELDTTTWKFEPSPHFERTIFRYHYDGAPEYATEFSDGDHVTVVSCVLFGLEPEHLCERGRRYEKVACFTSSDECECPCGQAREEGNFHVEDREGSKPGTWCPLCETDDTDDSHYIYLGDGWAETVYRVVPTCTTCGVDLTDEDIDSGDGLCDEHATHEWRVWSGLEMKAVHVGSSGPEAYVVFLEACAVPGDHYVYLSRDGETVAETRAD
jgi:hypothetical protein